MTIPRENDQMRPVDFELNVNKWAEGSALCRFGDTHVLCTVTLEDDIPRWMKQQAEPGGWLTANYAMLPRSTSSRRRERIFPDGRTQEISRLIGRSLRMALDLTELGPRQLTVDCTVLQADGGTRTAAISGGWVAVALALHKPIASGFVPPTVHRHQIAAISAGIVDGEPVLDLAFEQDVAAAVDLNVVMTAAGELVEIQGTGEKEPLARADLDRLLELAERGIEQIVSAQRQALEAAGVASSGRGGQAAHG